jgi:type 1 glutamine amidotransferase
MMRVALFLAAVASVLFGADDRLVLEGKGKHVVLVSGDEEYRSEEMLPQIARILSKHHGFKCTVLFALDEDGTVNPNRSNIPGLETLAKADLLVLFTRFRDLPDEQMKHIVDYVEAGRPIIGIRTATHAFNFKTHKTYGDWSWNAKDGGFGRRVLGETWVSHHGKHGKQSTRGIFAKGQEKHPILRGIKNGEIWGPTDVYTARLGEDAVPLVLGEVVDGMRESDKAAEGKQNDPMMPVAWTRSYKGGRVFTTTMGASQDFVNEGFRRLLVNAVYWGLGMNVPPRARVEIVGEYAPTPFGFNGFKKGLKPGDFTK